MMNERDVRKRPLPSQQDADTLFLHNLQRMMTGFDPNGWEKVCDDNYITWRPKLDLEDE